MRNIDFHRLERENQRLKREVSLLSRNINDLEQENKKWKRLYLSTGELANGLTKQIRKLEEENRKLCRV